MNQPKPILVQVTDTRITQYLLHATDPGEAIRDCGARGIEVLTTADVRAQAVIVTESQYDAVVGKQLQFSVIPSPQVTQAIA